MWRGIHEVPNPYYDCIQPRLKIETTPPKQLPMEKSNVEDSSIILLRYSLGNIWLFRQPAISSQWTLKWAYEISNIWLVLWSKILLRYSRGNVWLFRQHWIAYSRAFDTSLRAVARGCIPPRHTPSHPVTHWVTLSYSPKPLLRETSRKRHTVSLSTNKPLCVIVFKNFYFTNTLS